MDDMIGAIQPSVAVGQHVKQQILPKGATNSYGLENYPTMFEGIASGTDGVNSASPMCQLASSNSKRLELPIVPAMATSNNFPLKRTLPSLYWNDHDQDATGASSSKILHLDDSSDDHDQSGARTSYGNASTPIATLLSQLPQTPSLHQQVMLGSINGDGLFRSPCQQLPGLNWYS